MPLKIVGAGRTDAGVHAKGQVVSFESPSDFDPTWLRERINRRLAPEVSVRSAVIVPDTFDARHSARRRTYEYRLYRSSTPDPFLDRFAVWAPERFDLRAMRSAAKTFLGDHDFSSFCRRGEGTLVRRLRSIAIATPEPERLVIRVVGDSFCHQMVRSIVGLLLEIGRGKRLASDAAKALAAKDRSAAGPVAPAKGLSLVAVAYERDPFGRAEGGGDRRGRGSPGLTRPPPAGSIHGR